jgi:transposase
MSKCKGIFEIDISKDVFDVYGSKIGHNQFKIASQLCSYVGITPTIRQSGSSVRGSSNAYFVLSCGLPSKFMTILLSFFFNNSAQFYFHF